MSKLVIGISASITAFILALTAGAIYAYSNNQAGPVAVQPQPASQVATTLQLSAPAAAAPAAPAAVPQNLAPQDAASIAAKAINRTDLYSVELTTYQAVQAYKVTFSSGDIVYVGMTGQVLGSELPPAPIIITQSGGGYSQHGGGGGGSGGSYDEHEHEGGGGDD